MNDSGASCTTRLSFGPLLFLLYAKDLIENVQGTKLVLFADETNLLITRKD
jgi:hypothetical protein